jgi:hypothetical protein
MNVLNNQTVGGMKKNSMWTIFTQRAAWNSESHRESKPSLTHSREPQRHRAWSVEGQQLRQLPVSCRLFRNDWSQPIEINLPHDLTVAIKRHRPAAAEILVGGGVGRGSWMLTRPPVRYFVLFWSVGVEMFWPFETTICKYRPTMWISWRISSVRFIIGIIDTVSHKYRNIWDGLRSSIQLMQAVERTTASMIHSIPVSPFWESCDFWKAPLVACNQWLS